MKNLRGLLWVAALLVAVAAVFALKASRKAPGEGAPGAVGPVPATGEAPAAALPRLLDLGAGQCASCKMMKPVLEELGRDTAGRLRVDFLDVRENPDAVETYRIRIIPTQIFLSPSGEELFRHEGFLSREDLLAKWKELGYGF